MNIPDEFGLFFRFSVSLQMNYGISLSGVPHIKSVMWI